MVRNVACSVFVAVFGVLPALADETFRIGASELGQTRRAVEVGAGDLVEVFVVEVGPDISVQMLGVDDRPLEPLARFARGSSEAAVFAAREAGTLHLWLKPPERVTAMGYVTVGLRIHRDAGAETARRRGAWTALGEALAQADSSDDPNRAAQVARQFEAARRIWSGVGDAEAELVAALAACRSLVDQGNFALVESAAVLSDSLPPGEIGRALFASLLVCRGDSLAERGKSAQAIERYRHARRIFDEDQNAVGRAGADMSIGTALDDLSRPAGDRLPLHREAAATFGAYGAWALQAVALTGAGLALEEVGETDAAHAAYEQALAQRSPDDLWGRAVTHNNLARLLLEEGDLRGALDNFLRALGLTEEAGRTHHLDVFHNNLGAVYRRLGLHARARTHYERALYLREHVTPRGPFALATTLQNLGLLESREHNFERAEELLVRALTIQRTELDAPRPETLENLGRLYTDQERFAEAGEFLEKALLSYREREHPLGEARSLAGLGVIAAAQGRVGEGLALLNQALSIARPLSKHVAAGIHYDKARVLQRAGRFEDGLDSARTAAALRSEQEWALNGTGFQSRFFHSKLPQLRLQTSLWLAIWERDDSPAAAARAFEAYEEYRGRSIAELLVRSGTRLRAGLDDATLQRERELVRALDRAERARRTHLRQDEPVPTALTSDLARLQREYDLLEARINREAPARHRLLSPPPARVAEIQQRLAQDTGLVVYFLGDETTYAWYLTQDSLHTYALGPTSRITELSDALVTTLATQRGASTSRNSVTLFAYELGRLLLGPLADDRLLVSHPRLLVVPDGILQSVPFELLALGAQAEGPLVKENAVVYLPSATTLAFLSDRQVAEASLQLAVYADPVTSPDDPRLTASPPTEDDHHRLDPWSLDQFDRIATGSKEAHAITEPVAPDQRMLALGFDATREHFLVTAGSARVIHLNGHGVFTNTNPSLSGIALTRYLPEGSPIDGDLLLHDLYNLQLRADLVVLSSCETARNPTTAGAIGSVSHAFIHAGAQRVIGSLWPVRGEATTALLRRFYARYWQGVPAPQALQLAKNDLRTDGPWTHPYYWAGFVLYGAP